MRKTRGRGESITDTGFRKRDRPALKEEGGERGTLRRGGEDQQSCRARKKGKKERAVPARKRNSTGEREKIQQNLFSPPGGDPGYQFGGSFVILDVRKWGPASSQKSKKSGSAGGEEISACRASKPKRKRRSPKRRLVLCRGRKRMPKSWRRGQNHLESGSSRCLTFCRGKKKQNPVAQRKRKRKKTTNPKKKEALFSHPQRRKRRPNQSK